MLQNQTPTFSRKFEIGTVLYGWYFIPYHVNHTGKTDHKITIQFSIEQGTNGSIHDVEFYIMNEEPFLKWARELPAQQSNVTVYSPKDVIHKINKTKGHSVKLDINEEQTLYLVFSNTHSLVTKKQVTLEIFEHWNKTVVAKTPTEFIRIMWESGKFTKSLSLWDIENFAKSKGYTFTQKAIRSALSKLDFIINTGKLSNGVPTYSQVYPHTPLIGNEQVPKHIQIFESLSLHPEIKSASEELFRNGHYTQAISDALKKVNNMVKRKSEKHDLDGKSLMLHVFSPNFPILKLNHLKTITEKDEQEGFMHLFAGSMQGIRNPKVHDEIIQEDPFKTIEYLCLASLLAKAIDISTKPV